MSAYYLTSAYISIRASPPPSNALDSSLGWRGGIAYLVTLVLRSVIPVVYIRTIVDMIKE